MPNNVYLTSTRPPWCKTYRFTMTIITLLNHIGHSFISFPVSPRLIHKSHFKNPSKFTMSYKSNPDNQANARFLPTTAYAKLRQSQKNHEKEFKIFYKQFLLTLDFYTYNNQLNTLNNLRRFITEQNSDKLNELYKGLGFWSHFYPDKCLEACQHAMAVVTTKQWLSNLETNVIIKQFPQFNQSKQPMHLKIAWRCVKASELDDQNIGWINLFIKSLPVENQLHIAHYKKTIQNLIDRLKSSNDIVSTDLSNNINKPDLDINDDLVYFFNLHPNQIQLCNNIQADKKFDGYCVTEIDELLFNQFLFKHLLSPKEAKPNEDN